MDIEEIIYKENPNPAEECNQQTILVYEGFFIRDESLRKNDFLIDKL